MAGIGDSIRNAIMGMTPAGKINDAIKPKADDDEDEKKKKAAAAQASAPSLWSALSGK